MLYLHCLNWRRTAELLNWRRSLFFCTAVLLQRMRPGNCCLNFLKLLLAPILSEICLKFCQFSQIASRSVNSNSFTTWCCIDTTSTTSTTKVRAIVTGIFIIIAITNHNITNHICHGLIYFQLMFDCFAIFLYTPSFLWKPLQTPEWMIFTDRPSESSPYIIGGKYFAHNRRGYKYLRYSYGR